MTIIADLASNRELYRRRYVQNYGWVQSSDSFYARIQPKWSDALNRTSTITFEELFLNNTLFRDNEDIDGHTFLTTDTAPTSGESLIAAQTGIWLAAGDRVIEPSSGRLWIVRAVNEFRDANLEHDEIITSEASHLEARWVEYGSLLTLSASGNYDPLFNQYSHFNIANYTKKTIFGAPAFYDSERFSRDSGQVIRSAKGKTVSELIAFYIDSDFGLNENSLIELRGRVWRVEFIDESFFRVLKIGMKPYLERDANDTLIKRPSQERYL
jgi:hypothetical protein